MKRLLLLSLLLSAFHLTGQISDHSVRFKDYTPKWNHIVVDSTYLGVPEYNGVQHLDRSILQTIITKDAIYKTYINIKNSWQGGLVEKVNLLDGHILWSSPYDLRTTDEREIPQDHYLDDDGHLVVLGFRAAKPPIYKGYLWSDGTFVKRTYDIASGELIDYRYGDKKDTTTAHIYWSPIWPSVRILPISANNFLYILNDGSVNFRNIYMQEDGTKILDTLYQAPETKYTRASSNQIIRIHPDSLLVLFHNIKFENNRFVKDSFLLQAHYYDTDWKQVRTVDLMDKVAPATTFYLISADDEFYNILRVDGESPTDNSNLLFDHRWNLIGEIPWISAFNTSRTQYTKLKNEPGYLYVTTTKNPSRMKFYKADYQGHISHLRTLDMLAPNVKVESVHALDGGDLLLVCHAYYKPSKDPLNPDFRQINILRIDGKDLGLVTKTGDISSSSSEDYKILENPVSSGSIRLSFGTSFSGKVILSDVRGGKLRTYTFDRTKDAVLSVEGLPPGEYFIQPQSSTKQFEAKKVVILPR